MAAPTGWSWLAYTVDQDDGGPLLCLEAARFSLGDERWRPVPLAVRVVGGMPRVHGLAM